MTRPLSIIAFERIFLISLALGLLNSLLNWDRIAARMRPGTSGMVLIGVLVVVTVISLLLLWFISRRGSSVARWINVVLVGASFPLALIRPPEALNYGLVPAAITVAQYLLAAVSLWLLFRPDARRWFRKEWWSVDPEIFR